MLYGKINNIKVSKIVLGSALFGTSVGFAETEEIIKKYVDLGGNTINSARLYGDSIDAKNNLCIGIAESVIGDVLSKNKLRNKVVLTTKGGHPDIHIPDFVKNAPSRINREDLTFDIDKSLQALKTDYIDVYCLHRDNPEMPVGEIVEILNDFIKEGKCLTIGASNWKKERIDEANSYAKKHGLVGFSLSEIEKSYACINKGFIGDPTTVRLYDEEEAKYEGSNFPVVGYAAQASGLFYFAEKYGKNFFDCINPILKEKFFNEKTLSAIEKVKELATKEEISYTAASLKLLHEEKDIFSVIGPLTVEQVEDSLMIMK